MRRKTHETIKRVTVDIDQRQQMNTAVSAMMELVNELYAFTDKGERSAQAGKVAKPRARLDKDADTAAVEKRLSDALGLTVSIEQRGAGGELRVRYRNLEQLDEVIRRLERS